MIDIKFDEDDVFTFDNKNISIGIHQGKTGYQYIGNVSFFNLKQAEQFAEMIDLISETIKEEINV